MGSVFHESPKRGLSWKTFEHFGHIFLEVKADIRVLTETLVLVFLGVFMSHVNKGPLSLS